MNSKTVFALRNEAKNLEGIFKLNKLTEALNLAQRLFSSEPYDDWVQKAFAYTLIDLSKYNIDNKNINQAGVYFNQLLSIDFQEIDEIIESQKNFLRPKIDTNYSDVQKAEELSKNGNNIEALTIFKTLISQNRLTELHHESYGWIIYRYIKVEESNLSSVDVRTFLRDYMNLKNERPSMLHSMILNFALNYSKSNNDFKFYNFFLLWNPDNLRHEDLHNGSKDGKDIPSLISRICREFVNSNTEINIEYFLSKINLNKEVVIDFFREPIFWNILNAHKENKFFELWSLFEQYNKNYSNHGQSKWHSEILNLAERFMKEKDEWRFINFFKNWNPENLRTDDWKETKKDEHTYKPLATKAIKKGFEVLKIQLYEQDLSWLIKSYETAIKFLPEDEWLLREKALLHFKNNELELAVKIYKQLVLELADKHYVWQEFSDCIVSDNSLKIGMLSKALSLEKNEDFLGNIHLELAKTLFDNELIENCIIELNLYKKHRELKGWRLTENYVEILDKTKNQNVNIKDNKNLYEKYIPIAEQYAYEEIEWTELVLVDKWKNDEGKERVAFTNGKAIDFSIGSRRFNLLKQSSSGNVYKFKLHKQEIRKEVEAKFAWMGKTIVKDFKYIPLIVEKSQKSDWCILDDLYATIDYINTEKNIVHAITSDNKEVFFPKGKIQLQIGEFIKAKYFTKKVKDEIRIELKDITRIDKEVAIIHFPKIIAIIDVVNKEKNLFHYVGDKTVQGIIKLTETDIIPEEGKFLEIFYTTKKHRAEKRLIIKAINISETEEKNPKLIKAINGNLILKYKRGGSTVNYYDLDEDELNGTFPDFGFVGDFYVPRCVLSNNKITTNCNITATAIFSRDKWKIIKLVKELTKIEE